VCVCVCVCVWVGVWCECGVRVCGVCIVCMCVCVCVVCVVCVYVCVCEMQTLGRIMKRKQKEFQIISSYKCTAGQTVTPKTKVGCIRTLRCNRYENIHEVAFPRFKLKYLSMC